MTVDFQVLQSIKNTIKENNEKIIQRNELVYVYLGFCEHLLAYIEAYEELFNSKNYYVCRALDRTLLDLYIKSRFLNTVPNPLELARHILLGKPIKRFRFQEKENWTDIELCQLFDKKDNNYSMINGMVCHEENKQPVGWWQKRYMDGSKFIHPSKQNTYEYLKNKGLTYCKGENNGDNEKQNAIDFMDLANKILQELSDIGTDIIKAQKEKSYDTYK